MLERDIYRCETPNPPLFNQGAEDIQWRQETSKAERVI